MRTKGIGNPTVDEPHAREGSGAWEGPRVRPGASPVERSLIDALTKRYADPQPADWKPLDLAFADAMRALWKENPGDTDVGALYAEALTDLRPWTSGPTTASPSRAPTRSSKRSRPCWRKKWTTRWPWTSTSTCRRSRCTPARPTPLPTGSATSSRAGPRSPHALARRRPPGPLEGGGAGQRESDRGRRSLPQGPAEPRLLPHLHAP